MLQKLIFYFINCSFVGTTKGSQGFRAFYELLHVIGFGHFDIDWNFVVFALQRQLDTIFLNHSQRKVRQQFIVIFLFLVDMLIYLLRVLNEVFL